MKNVLVTGSAGYIGQVLVSKLRSLGLNVVELDMVNRDGNIMSGLFLKFPPPEVDTIFHLAASTRVNESFNNPVKYTLNNVLCTNMVLDFAKNFNSKVIYTSTCCSYGDIYANPYALTKYQGEQLCMMYSRLFGVSTAIARFYNVFGGCQPQDDKNGLVLGIFQRLYKLGRPLPVYGGEQRRDFIHVEDIVDGLIRLADKEYRAEVFNFGSGKNYSISQIAQMFNCPLEYHPQRKGEEQETLADISKTLELGWSPTLPVEDYIKDFVKNNPYNSSLLT